jgi:hypothetical protein
MIALIAVAALLATPTPAVARTPAGEGRRRGCQSTACWGRVHQARRWRWARRQEARVTPYRCAGGARFAIPCYVVQCESHGRWGAYNASSGARGPYQFLGWRVPWPVRTWRDRLAHHRMAAALWRGGAGAGQWSCA